jgi:hypothetical protein
LASSVREASPRAFCGVQLHGLTARQTLQVVEALQHRIVRRGRREDAMGLFEQLLLPPADDRVRSPRNAARATFALNSGLNFRGFAIGETSSTSGYPHTPMRPVFGAQYSCFASAEQGLRARPA